MFSYEQWNQGLLRYFLEEAPPGSAVFLSVEPIVLADVACSLGSTLSAEAAALDLCTAVRSKCLRPSGRLDGANLLALSSATEPGQVAFLAGLVLAAYRMQDDDEAGISERCYYARLAEVLSLRHTTRLLMGFGFAEKAEDRQAWDAWNVYLKSRGYKATARAGLGAWTYIRYAESQTLLRVSDQDWLEQLFAREIERHRLSKYLSKDQLGVWLRRPELGSGQSVRRLVRDLITETDLRRRDAFLAQAYAIYTDCNPHSRIEGRSSRIGFRRSATRIDAGLLRRVRLGRPPQYFVYPQSPTGRPVPSGACVVVNGIDHLLEPDDRPGWCRPVMAAPELMGRQVFDLKNAGTYTTLLFPERSIWSLVSDPQDGDAADRASWEEPIPGAPFVALVRSQKHGSMRALQSAGLLDWRSGPHVADGLLGWDEYRDCQIIQTVWAQTPSELGCDEEVYEALRPGKQERVILQGGLRYPGERAMWLAGAPPLAVAYASCEPLKLTLRRFDRPSVGVSEPVNSGAEWALGSHGAAPGEYEISLVHSPAREGERVLAEARLVVADWSGLQADMECAAGVGDGFEAADSVPGRDSGSSGVAS